MIHFSLFSGIGGFDLASEWMGWNNYLSCELADFPNKVLKHYWPKAYHHRDIKTLNYDTIQDELTRRFGEWRTEPIILTGGFPCQPYSLAGQRKGKEDERHLWPEMLRLIHEIKPDFIVGENVFGLLNWNGGMVFDEVLTDLGTAGYDVTPVVIPAAAVNAPHGRDRVWFVAYSKGNGNRRKLYRMEGENDCKRKPEKYRENNCKFRDYGAQWNATDTDGDGFNECNGNDEKHSSKGGKYAQRDIKQIHNEQPPTKHANLQRQKWGMHEVKSETTIGKQFGKRNARSIKSTKWHNFPTQSPICGGNDGIPTELDGITLSKWRKESIKGYGNAIVPQVVYEIFKAIELAYSEITK